MTARLGLVGTSEWAWKVHGGSAVSHPDVELVGVWGRDGDKAEVVADALGTQARSWEALLDAVDVLSFAVPPSVQVELAVRAAERGVHLLLEKPVAVEDAQARRLVEASRRVQSRVFLTRLWEPRTVAWLDHLVAEGGWSAGRASFVNALTAERLGASPWRVEHGALWDVGPHALSVLERVLGEVQDVRGAAVGPDVVEVLLRHRSGAVSTAELSLTAVPAAARTGISFWGTGGRSPDAPVLGLDDVVAAHSAALTSLLHADEAHGRDAAYGAHLTRLLTRISQACSPQ